MYTEEQHAAALAIYNELRLTHKLVEEDRKNLLDAIHTFEYAVTEGEDYPQFPILYRRMKGYVDDIRRKVEQMDQLLQELRGTPEFEYASYAPRRTNENS